MLYAANAAESRVHTRLRNAQPSVRPRRGCQEFNLSSAGVYPAEVAAPPSLPRIKAYATDIAVLCYAYANVVLCYVVICI